MTLYSSFDFNNSIIINSKVLISWTTSLALTTIELHPLNKLNPLHPMIGTNISTNSNSRGSHLTFHQSPDVESSSSQSNDNNHLKHLRSAQSKENHDTNTTNHHNNCTSSSAHHLNEVVFKDLLGNGNAGSVSVSTAAMATATASVKSNQRGNGEPSRSPSRKANPKAASSISSTMSSTIIDNNNNNHQHSRISANASLASNGNISRTSKTSKNSKASKTSKTSTHNSNSNSNHSNQTDRDRRRKYSASKSNSKNASNSHTSTATATNTAATSNATTSISSDNNMNHNNTKSNNHVLTNTHSKSQFNSNGKQNASQSGLTIQVSNNNNLPQSSSSFLKMNPRDAASPRRHRGRTSKSKMYKDFEASILDMNIDTNANAVHHHHHHSNHHNITTTTTTTTNNNNTDSVSIQSWKDNANPPAMTPGSAGGCGGDRSIASASSKSVQSSSIVGGLAYIETPSEKTSASVSVHISPSPSPYHQNHSSAAMYHPTNATSSVSSKSTVTSKRSVSSSRRNHQNTSKSQICNTIQTQQLNRPQSSSSPSPTALLGPGRQEQILFEQRLCDEEIGVAVKKIHSNGKSQLRYVKCISIPPNDKYKGRHNKHSSSNSNNNNMSHSLPSPNYMNQHHTMMTQPSALSSSQLVSSSRSVTSLMGRITAGRKNKQQNTSNSVMGGDKHIDDSSPTSQYSKSMHSVDNSNNKSSKIIKESPSASSQDEKRYTKALTWGNKKKILVPLHQFVAVCKGKTTKRTKRNTNDSCRLLSIITSSSNNESHGGVGSLDIEAPTELDRDKFAKAFSVFLNVPLVEENEHFDGSGVGGVIGKDGSGSLPGHGTNTTSSQNENRFASSSHHSYGDDMSSLPSTSTYNSSAFTPAGGHGNGLENSLLPNLTPSPTSSKDEPKLLGYCYDHDNEYDKNNDRKVSNHWNEEDIDDFDPLKESEKNNDPSKQIKKNESTTNKGNDNIFDMDSKLLAKDNPKRKRRKDRDGDNDNDEEDSEVSSLTQGFDQEIVEELHQALTELRAELEASRAEAARAVKVAEQAIQSAESCSSNDWNSTVTHKAAEAAAQAQKRSAEAISKQRQAEEKLAAEKKSASFWRKQAQVAEEDVGGLQTRLAVAEVERAEITEELEREKRKAASYIQTFKRDHAISESIQRETLANAAEQNKLLEIELDGTRRDLLTKAHEVKSLQDTLVEL